MILNLLSTAYFYITILNRTAWFNIYKNISLIFIIFQVIFIRSRNRIKQDFFSSVDICEDVSPVQVILITWVKYKIAKWILINFDHTVLQDIFKHIHLRYTTFISSLCSQFVRPFLIFAEDFNVLSLGVLYFCKYIIDAN